MRGKINDSSFRGARLDASTHSVQVVEYDHHEIHAGSTYRAQTNNDAIASGEDIEIVWKVKDGSKLPHLIFEYETEGLATVQLKEGVDVTLSTGSDVEVKNSRRDKANASIMQGLSTGAWVDGYVTSNATYSNGTVISLKKAYSSAKAGGSSGSRRSEIILKSNTTYAIALTNDEATAKGGQIRMEWYEHTDKD